VMKTKKTEYPSPPPLRRRTKKMRALSKMRMTEPSCRRTPPKKGTVVLLHVGKRRGGRSLQSPVKTLGRTRYIKSPWRADYHWKPVLAFQLKEREQRRLTEEQNSLRNVAVKLSKNRLSGEEGVGKRGLVF